MVFWSAVICGWICPLAWLWCRQRTFIPQHVCMPRDHSTLIIWRKTKIKGQRSTSCFPKLAVHSKEASFLFYIWIHSTFSWLSFLNSLCMIGIYFSPYMLLRIYYMLYCPSTHHPFVWWSLGRMLNSGRPHALKGKEKNHLKIKWLLRKLWPYDFLAYLSLSLF